MSRRMWMQVVTRLALIAVLMGALVNAFATLIEEQQPVLAACEYEDSRDCIWDADVAGAGNGGVSFVDIDGVIYYREAGQ